MFCFVENVVRKIGTFSNIRLLFSVSSRSFETLLIEGLSRPLSTSSYSHLGRLSRKRTREM